MHARDEPGADPLDRVGRVRAAGEDRREGRLHRVDLQARPALLEDLGDPGDVAAGPDAGHDVVEPVGEVGQDLLGRRPAVDRRVGRVVELHRDPGARDLGGELVRPGDRALHPQLARRQLQLRAVAGHQLAALDRHRLGHRQDQPVALHRADEGEADPGVARGRLDDDRARAEDPGCLGVLDHRQRDAVLDAAARVGALHLEPDLDAGVEEAVHPDVGRVADGGEDGLGLHGALLFGWCCWRPARPGWRGRRHAGAAAGRSVR